MSIRYRIRLDNLEEGQAIAATLPHEGELIFTRKGNEVVVEAYNTRGSQGRLVVPIPKPAIPLERQDEATDELVRRR